MRKGKMIAYTFRLNPNHPEDKVLQEQIQRGAEENDLSVAAFIRNELARHFADREAEYPKEELLQHIRQEYDSQQERTRKLIEEAMYQHDTKIMATLVGLLGNVGTMDGKEEPAKADLPEEGEALPEDMGSVLELFQ